MKDTIASVAFKLRMTRLGLALHVLQGRPLMYRCETRNGTIVAKQHTWIVQSEFRGAFNPLASYKPVIFPDPNQGEAS